MKRLIVPFVDSSSVMAGTLFLLITFVPALVIPDTISVLPPLEVSKLVAIHNKTMKDNIVSGELLNLSSHRIRDVELLIRQIWHWNNEFRPGANPPGAADYYTVTAETPSGVSERFTYKLSPPPSRSDGYFETVVTVAGFTEIKQQGEEWKNIDAWRPISDLGSRDDVLTWIKHRDRQSL
jgi:hypothetical protein